MKKNYPNYEKFERKDLETAGKTKEIQKYQQNTQTTLILSFWYHFEENSLKMMIFWVKKAWGHKARATYRQYLVPRRIRKMK